MKKIFLVLVIPLLLGAGCALPFGNKTSVQYLDNSRPRPVVINNETGNNNSVVDNWYLATNDWKTYTNTKYNYSVKYPKNWSASALDENCPPKSKPILTEHNLIGFVEGVDIRDCIGPAKAGTFSILVSNVEPALAVGGEVVSKSNSNFTIANITAVRTDGYFKPGGDPSTSEPFSVVKFKNGDYYFMISGDESDVFKTFLATFKFTDQIVNSDWQTYTDNDLGYQISYPKDWQVNSNAYPGCEITLCDSFYSKGVSIKVGREYNKIDSSFEDYYNNQLSGSQAKRIFFTTEPQSIPYKMFKKESDLSQYSIAKDDLESYWTAAGQYIYKDGYVYYIELNLLQTADLQASLGVFDEMLSSFKFTK